jgi:hypothetical protein
MEENDSTLQEARQLAESLASSLPRLIRGDASTEKSKLPFKAQLLSGLLIHRISPLAEAAVDLFERDQVIPAVVLTRAGLETVAVLYSLHDRLERFFEDKDVGKLNEFLTCSLCGSRNNADLPNAKNVVTFVERTAKAIPEFLATYKILSEFTHPNWAGTLGSFGEIDKENCEVRLGPTGRTRAWEIGVSALSGVLMFFRHYYDNSDNLIQRLNDHIEQSGPGSPGSP